VCVFVLVSELRVIWFTSFF